MNIFNFILYLKVDPAYNGSMNSELFKINETLFKDIFKEALQMKGFEHEHVMKVLGVSLETGSKFSIRFKSSIRVI